jgi:precorrin-8X/cobalt-precorrin-8 methylmutase
MSAEDTKREALVHGLYRQPLTGEEIEARSFAAIDREAPAHTFGVEPWAIVRRMIHTTADFSLARDVRFSERAIESGAEALQRGAPIYVDSNMIRAGLSLARLKRVCPAYSAEAIHCHVADADVAAAARDSRLPRSLHAVRKAQRMLDGGIAVFGNAPVGLLELNRLVLEAGVRPALVVAMPVGFVHVVESKEELMTLGVPFIALSGRRGGSPLAVSVIHALCGLAGGAAT